eukprot:gb/GECH01013182.1/.p1 GENE.gb/GECH01013182.1/~~gb/GECH01013182.1/.p1  ORF type:complete len:423 (+),score=54.22 gb/GECH01013182.1/:1-1269(+)
MNTNKTEKTNFSFSSGSSSSPSETNSIGVSSPLNKLLNEDSKGIYQKFHHFIENASLARIGLLCASTILMTVWSLLTALSKNSSEDGSYPYRPAVVNLFSEILKFVISFVILKKKNIISLIKKHVIQNNSNDVENQDNNVDGSEIENNEMNDDDDFEENNSSDRWTLEVLKRSFFQRHTLLYAVPALLYVLLNNMFFLALSFLNPEIYQLSYNFKVVTTALFLYFFLSKRISRVQWFALGLLTIGMALGNGGNIDWSSITLTRSDVHASAGLLGLMVVMGMCVVSAAAGTFSEYLLKHSTEPTELKNMKLYMFGIMVQSVVLLFNHFLNPSGEGGLFGELLVGFSYMLTWCIVLNTALNGLAVSYIMRHFDNITKVYVFAVSMILTSIASMLTLQARPPAVFYVAVAAVSFSLYLYNKENSK